MSNELAVKALNQYRKRDIFPYLALRYYVESFVGRQNRWIEEVCTRLVVQNNSFGYLRMYHFKDVDEEKYVHRDIYVPAPNEALSEIALITELSKYEAFVPRPYVYSYRFSGQLDKNGAFKPYFDGFKERHRSISNACRREKEGVVLYTDIKKFYPSIDSKDAIHVWEDACKKSEISKSYRQLGLTILGNHQAVSEKDGTGKGLLTGPAFSHVIANLLLDSIDKEMSEISGGNYWRYVDDVVFVGTASQVSEWRKKLQDKCGRLGLFLHDGDKDFQVSCKEWLLGEFDLDDSIGIEWVSLITDVKRFLIANPSKTNELVEAFRKNDIRIPVVDYSNAVKDSNYLQRFQDWLRKYNWAAMSVKSITVSGLVKKAKNCETSLSKNLMSLLQGDIQSSQYAEKRVVPKLRYLSGRLLYLSSREALANFYEMLKSRTSMNFIAKTMQAVSSRDFTDVLSMGVNVAHSAAQLVRAEADKSVHINKNIEINSVVEQSLAVLVINGLQHDYKKSVNSDLILLAEANEIKKLMRAENLFVKESACLHGLAGSRHQLTLDTCFDRDEDLAMDVLNQLQRSSHC